MLGKEWFAHSLQVLKQDHLETVLNKTVVLFFHSDEPHLWHSLRAETCSTKVLGQTPAPQLHPC